MCIRVGGLWGLGCIGSLGVQGVGFMEFRLSGLGWDQDLGLGIEHLEAPSLLSLDPAICAPDEFFVLVTALHVAAVAPITCHSHDSRTVLIWRVGLPSS